MHAVYLLFIDSVLGVGESVKAIECGFVNSTEFCEVEACSALYEWNDCNVLL